MRAVISGNHAQSHAARLARPHVVAAYPITPQTSIVEELSEWVAKGEMKTQLLRVESEHSALQACISAAALGARTYTATSSQGLLLMNELLHWASGARAPIVMGVANRAVAPPWSLMADHADTMAQRDTGWMQFYVEGNQEALDTVLMAYRLAEREEVLLPAMVAMDAFYLTHTLEPVDIPDQAQVDGFLPPRGPVGVLRPASRGRYGSFTGPELYMEFRRKVAEAMGKAARLLPQVEDEYEAITGRHHGGRLPTYHADDADGVLITMGTATTTARTAVDALRAKGFKVGLAKLRVFRPFPFQEVRELASAVDRIGVVDRSYTYGGAGPAYSEVAAALYAAPERPLLHDFVAGLGGRDLTPATFQGIYHALLHGRLEEVEWVELRRRGVVPFG